MAGKVEFVVLYSGEEATVINKKNRADDISNGAKVVTVPLGEKTDEEKKLTMALLKTVGVLPKGYVRATLPRLFE